MQTRELSRKWNRELWRQALQIGMAAERTSPTGVRKETTVSSLQHQIRLAASALAICGMVFLPSMAGEYPPCQWPVWSPPGTVNTCACTTVWPEAVCTGSVTTYTGHWYCRPAKNGVQDCPAGPMVPIGTVTQCVKALNVSRLLACAGGSLACSEPCCACVTPTTCVLCVGCLVAIGAECLGCPIADCVADPTTTVNLLGYNRTWVGTCP